MIDNQIYNFYKKAMEENRFSETFVEELKAIENKDKLQRFIEDKVYPIAESMGYDFTMDDLMCYEAETAKQLSEDEIEMISGGAGMKEWVLGGMISLLTMGGRCSVV